MMVQPSKKTWAEETGASRALELALQRNNAAPAIARAAVTGWCDDLDLSGSLCHTLVLLVSEVVTNAVLHSRGPDSAPVILTATVTDDSLHLTVTDAGHGFNPRPRDPAGGDDGYGLYLLDKAADRWGVDTVGGTRVWFELSRTA
jgi:anti-sigma regulatory factor (Ser/Thr protein kinase)